MHAVLRKALFRMVWELHSLGLALKSLRPFSNLYIQCHKSYMLCFCGLESYSSWSVTAQTLKYIAIAAILLQAQSHFLKVYFHPVKVQVVSVTFLGLFRTCLPPDLFMYLLPSPFCILLHNSLLPSLYVWGTPWHQRIGSYSSDKCAFLHMYVVYSHSGLLLLFKSHCFVGSSLVCVWNFWIVCLFVFGSPLRPLLCLFFISIFSRGKSLLNYISFSLFSFCSHSCSKTELIFIFFLQSAIPTAAMFGVLNTYWSFI